MKLIYVRRYDNRLAISVFHRGHLDFSDVEDVDLCDPYQTKMGCHPNGWKIPEEDSRYEPFVLEDERPLFEAIDTIKEIRDLEEEPINLGIENRLKELRNKLEENLTAVKETIYKNPLSL